MSTFDDQIKTVEGRAREAASKVAPWVVASARVGYAAKGVTYVLAGTLALSAAFSYAGGRAAGPTQAMASLLDHPYGSVALAVIAAGLTAYAGWCLVQVLADPDRWGRGLRGLWIRTAHFLKALAYLGLVGVVTGTLTGAVRSSPGHDAVEDATARLMQFPLGTWLVAGAGAGVVWAGAFQAYLACRPERSVDRPDLRTCGPTLRACYLSVGRVGVAARGVILAMVGLFMTLAAYDANPHEARGVGRSLRFLQHQRDGRWLLAFVAAGLIAYGLHQFILARYRRIDPT